MPEMYIAGLRTQLENFKEQASKDAKMFCYMNDEKLEKLLEQAKTIKVFFKALKVEEEYMDELNCIINQIEDFVDFVYDTNASRNNLIN